MSTQETTANSERDHQELDPSAGVALADVLRACEDGERGYLAAATGMPDPGYRLMFAHYAAERARFAKSLDDAVRALGLPSPQDGSALGSMHRGWLNAVSNVAKDHPKAVLRECRRGEDAALKTYRAAMRADLPPGIRDLVQEQYEAIKNAREELSSLMGVEGS